METLLKPHKEATLSRMAGEAVVLLPQDTSALNFTGLKKTTGLGPLGEEPGAKGRGLWLHSMLAYRPDGVPLGVLDARCWARQKADSRQDRRGRNAKSKWMLLTDMPIANAHEAWEKVRWYRCRWGIEEWHRVIKSGCRAEAREFKSAEHLKRVLAFDLIVAWRILACVKLGHALPQLPATVIYTAEELQVLWVAQKKGQPPPELTIQQANRMVAMLGGYAGRKGDQQPGAQSLGTGLRRLMDLTWGWSLRSRHPPNQANQLCV